MEIVHFAPFAPAAAGIYEAARDIVRADTERGHQVSFVDTGSVTPDGVQAAPQIGAIDDRGGFKIVTVSPQWADTADLLVYHTGVNDNWVVKSQAPIVFIVHGRPWASFKSEIMTPARNAYTLTAELSRWPRIKKVVSFWPEHQAFWRYIVPEEKLVILDWPPIDTKRFTPTGPVHVFAPEHKGKINALICDSWREDVDTFEIANGAIAAADLISGLKMHFYAVETVKGTQNLPHCWEYIMQALRQRGALGEIVGRVAGLEQVYRAVDFVMTPHRIVTRIVAEALASGTSVLAAKGCHATRWTADIQDPDSVAYTVKALVDNAKKDQQGERLRGLETASKMSLDRYGEKIELVYQEAVG